MDPNIKPFPWTGAVPSTHSPNSGCGADGMRIQRFMIENFGTSLTTPYPKIPRTFGGKVCWIGPNSEMDAVTLFGTAVGELVVSVGVPCIVPLDTDIMVLPHRKSAPAASPRVSRLELLAANTLPPGAGTWPRAPRVYPDKNSAALNSVTETVLFLKTEFVNNTARNVTEELPVMGAKSLALYLRSGAGNANISWRIWGLRGACLDEFPISPTGYPAATPTYNTILPGRNESYHLDMEANSFEFVLMGAKSTVAGGTEILTVGAEVRDGF